MKKKQQIINNFDDEVEGRVNEMFKNERHMLKDYDNLKAEKVILVEELEKSEEAYQQEVRMRLRFESKIN